jgi:hypothetical protein
MAVTKVKPKWKAADDTEFDSEDEAKRYDELRKAKRAFEDARRRYGGALAETTKTADGVPFNFTLLRDYFVVWDVFGSLPSLRQVSFYYWMTTVSVDERGEVEMEDYNHTRRDGTPTRYKVSELFADKSAARKALLAAQERYLADVTE